MLSDVAGDMESSSKFFTLETLKSNGGVIHTDTKVLEICDDSVKVETPDGILDLPANQVVVAVGSKSVNPLSAAVRSSYDVKVICDANQVSKALDGITVALLILC